LLAGKPRSGAGNWRKNQRGLPLKKNLEMGMFRAGHLRAQIIRTPGFMVHRLVALLMKACPTQMGLRMLHLSEEKMQGKNHRKGKNANSWGQGIWAIYLCEHLLDNSS
jgi:hypothetical protein